MYENYLLDPAAIANVICAEAPEVKATVDIERVSAWLASKTNDAPYVPAGGGKYPGTDWQVNVDGARVLRDVFSDLSLAKLCYSKVKHGKALTRFAIDQSDKAIHELASYLSELLP